jgi:hypothetical protein
MFVPLKLHPRALSTVVSVRTTKCGLVTHGLAVPSGKLILNLINRETDSVHGRPEMHPLVASHGAGAHAIEIGFENCPF